MKVRNNKNHIVFSGYLVVTVTYKAEKIELVDNTKTIIQTDGPHRLPCRLYPEYSTDTNFKVTFSEPILKVDEDMVERERMKDTFPSSTIILRAATTVTKKEKVTVTVTTENGASDSIEYEVKNNPAS